MIKKSHLDNDFRYIPTVRSSIPEIDNRLRIFIGKGNRVIIKIDKEMPEIEMAAKNIAFGHGTTSLILNSGIGALGLMLSVKNRDVNFLLYDTNVKNSKLSQRNLDVNFDYSRNARVVGEEEIPKPIDTVVYDIAGGYSAIQTIEENIFSAKNYLKVGGKFYLITYKKAGAERHENIVKNIFGSQNTAIITKGRGGYRIIEAINTGEKERCVSERRRTVEFSILGKHFSLFTKSGLFSKNNLDPGTRFLLESVDLNSFDRLLDLGCGWGAIGIVALIINPQGKALLVDIDSQAVKTARKNIEKLGIGNRARAIATDNVRALGNNFDLVLTNPPLHTDTGSLIEMFRRVKRILRKDGQIYLVVERTYLEKFKRVLDEVFHNHSTFNRNDNYYILSAQQIVHEN